MNYGVWVKNKSKNKTYIRREVLPRKGSAQWQNYKGEYNANSVEEVDSLLRRLNATHEQTRLLHENRYDYHNAYTNKLVLERFELELSKSATTKEHINKNMAYLKRALDFFIITKNLPVPTDWLKFEAEFGQYIESLGLGYDSMQRIIQITNRYLSFLRLNFQDEIPIIILNPIASKKLKNLYTLTQERLRDGSRFVDAKAWANISKNIPTELKPHAALAYAFGLRRGEVLGLTDKSFYRGYLYITEQLVGFTDGSPTYGNLKDTSPRKVPYWYATPTQALAWFDKMKLMHPDTLGHRFADAMTKLGYNFKLHDLRRTFITRAVAEKPINDVRLAVGHDDLSTTSRYLQDVRGLDDQPLR